MRTAANLEIRLTSKDANGLAFLGLFRFVLATSVVMFHLWTPVAPDAGRHAVVGFFLISGFLITKITREGYRGRPVAFVTNRFLRIYPQYAMAVLVCIVMVEAFPAVAAGGYLNSIMPSTLDGWLSQLTISTLGTWQTLLPPLWSLNTELYFYVFIGLLTHDSLKLTLACFGIGLVIAALSLFKLIGFTFYASAQSDAFMFFAGSLAYFWAGRFTMPRLLFVPALVSYAVTMYVVPHFIPIAAYAGPVPHACLLISAACTFVILVVLQQWPVRRSRWTAVSAYLGRLSYPVFLLHWSVAMPFAALFGSSKTAVFLAAYPAVLAASALMLRLVDSPVEGLRNAVRRAAAPPVRLAATAGQSARHVKA